jgi:hypothetical protein
MRLIGAVNCYQDVDMLKHSLPALRRLVDFLVVVDGAYSGFPLYNDDPESTDDSLALAQEYADHIIFCRKDITGKPVPWFNEIQKRSQYLQVGQPGDYYLVCDADETPTGTVHINRDELAKQTDWLVVLSRVNDHIKPYPIHRLFQHRRGIRYFGAHHAVHIGPRLIHPKKDHLKIFPGLRLDHLQMLRDRDRVERKGEYYRELQKAEADFRAKEGL